MSRKTERIISGFMVTIKDIARECGVSIATVSNILNGRQKAGPETRERVLAAVDKLGYKPNNAAKTLRSKRTSLIGIIAEDITHFTVFPIIEGIMHCLEENGYGTVLKNLRLYSRWSDKWFDNEDMVKSVLNSALSELNAMMTDGIIYVAVHERNVSLIPYEIKKPAVMTYAIEVNKNIPSIIMDDEQGGYDAVKYLIDKGHEKIGIICGKEDNLHTQMRLKGAMRALDECGIEIDKSLIRYSNWASSGGYKETRPLLGKGVSAIFCMADRMAGGVYRFLNEKGLRVGEDVSVMGYDNQDISEYLIPELSTISLPLKETGLRAAELLMDKLNTEDKSSFDENIYKMKCKLIERGSVCTLS